MATDNKTQQGDILEAKVKIYGLFANIFAKEPSLDFLRILAEEENYSLFKSFGIDCLSDIRYFSLQKQSELLAEEYARLFLVPGKPASLYESVQLGEGRLWAEPAAQVIDIYKKFGFSPDERFFNDAPDHLSVELSFLAQLSMLELKYSQEALLDAKKGLLEVKKYFLQNHLLKWFGLLEGQIRKSARLFFYKELVYLLGMILGLEQEGLDRTPDISDIS